MSDSDSEEELTPTTALGKAMSCAWDCVQFWTPLGFAVIILWLLYRPDRFRPAVDSAVLAALDLTAPPANNATDGRLRYDLTVDLSFRNSHRFLSIRYFDIGATAFYNGSTELGPTEDAFPTPFRQGPKNTTVLHSAFRGKVAVDSVVARVLETELAAGTLHLRVTVSLMLMYKLWPMQEFFFYNYDCWLWFPPPRDGVPAVFDAAGTQCWKVKSKSK